MRSFAKVATLRIARQLGLSTIIQTSKWRSQRLLILCYHGVSLNDEHCWSPELYLPRTLFERRLLAIRNGGYNFLPLNEALRRLYSGDLPPRSVCMTFDDGFHDFRAVAYPLLQTYDIPATVYLTSFYSSYQRPIFDLMCSYLLWKGRDQVLDSARVGLHRGCIPLAERSGRQRLVAELRENAHKMEYSAQQKDELLKALAHSLNVDYEALITSGILRIMSAPELADLDPNLVQIELHSHRHRVPLDKNLFRREILENRAYIKNVTKGRTNPTQFCYPSGVTCPTFLPWLRELGITSATTCRLGLASRNDDPLMLHRFLDSSNVSMLEFDGWLMGLASRIPRRRLIYSAPTQNGILA
jgi:peptidoglycan/xylan/chitin deacetylase (PgdA/CDA1 family)